MSILLACHSKPVVSKNSRQYFDLEGYFKAEASRLQQSAKPIKKEVMVNGKAEVKNLLIANWQREFKAFIDADINKAAWGGSFSVKKNDSVTLYKPLIEKIPVKKVEILRKNNQVQSIKIVTSTVNYIYLANDTLIYEPNSYYKIISSQRVKLLDEKRYQVTGKF